ncbi:MAG: hypothetical protein ACI8S6_003089 [Myxococcota bacterium]|jgi:hypothetical protein
MSRLKVDRLGEHRGPYYFTVRGSSRGDKWTVAIPGHAKNAHDMHLNGPTVAEHPEQEEWMKNHSGLREFWYLTWEASDPVTWATFLERLGLQP